MAENPFFTTQYHGMTLKVTPATKKQDMYIAGFLEWGYPNSWLVYFMEKPSINGWQLGVPPWIGHLHIIGDLPLGSSSPSPVGKQLHPHAEPSSVEPARELLGGLRSSWQKPLWMVVPSWENPGKSGKKGGQTCQIWLVMEPCCVYIWPVGDSTLTWAAEVVPTLDAPVGQGRLSGILLKHFPPAFFHISPCYSCLKSECPKSTPSYVRSFHISISCYVVFAHTAVQLAIDLSCDWEMPGGLPWNKPFMRHQ